MHDVREYVLPSLGSEIPLPTYLSYDPVTQTRFLLHEHPIDWLSVLEDYIDNLSDEEEDPFEDASDAKETLEIEEDPFKNYS